jgi:hypothetical protein
VPRDVFLFEVELARDCVVVRALMFVWSHAEKVVYHHVEARQALAVHMV